MNAVQIDWRAEIGERIFSLRRLRGMSQQKLADRAACSRNTISSIELGKKDMGIATLVAISAALDLEPHELLTPINQWWGWYGQELLKCRGIIIEQEPQP